MINVIVRKLVGLITDRRAAAVRWGAAGLIILVFLGFVWRATRDGSGERISQRPLKVEVKRVISGHKVKLDSDEQVVYAAIRTPYKYEHEGLYEKARQRNAELVDGKRARLRYDEKHRDAKNRLPAYLFVDGEFVNETLVREGLAYVRLTPQTPRFAERLLTALFRQRKKNGDIT